MPWTRRMKIGLAAAAFVGALPALAAGASWHGSWSHGWGHSRHFHDTHWCAGNGESRLGEAMTLIEMQLALKPEQQGAWARLAEAVERSGRDLKAVCGVAAGDAPAAPVRLEAGIEAGLQAVRTLRPHLEALYVALAPDQRARLDGLLKGRL